MIFFVQKLYFNFTLTLSFGRVSEVWAGCPNLGHATPVNPNHFRSIFHHFETGVYILQNTVGGNGCLGKKMKNEGVGEKK